MSYLKDDDEASSSNRTIFITRQIRYFVDDYIQEESLGEPGQFGTAYKCYRKTDVDKTRPFAVKEINKSRLTAAQPTEKDELLQTMQNEIAILLKVRHTNIVELYDVYESRDQLHLVMEYLPGGELFDRICQHSESGGYGEKEAANIIKQVLNALDVVHSKKILHLDLKPENILFKDNTDNTVKIIDFGMARVVPRLTLLKGQVGTIQYMAPEVISGELFSYGADVWSVGIILYSMLFGFPPFNDYEKAIGDILSSEKFIENKIMTGFEPVVKDGYGAWFPKEMPISGECMKLLSNMLQKDVPKRWTVKECLSSKWILQKDGNENVISPLFRDSLLKYTKKNKFRIAITNLFGHYLDMDVKQEIAKHFNEMDTNHDGKLSLKEFEVGLKKLNDTISSDQIEEIFKNLDFNNDLTISLNELIMSTNMTSLMSRDERLYAAFEKLDVNHDGRIDKSEMELAVKGLFDAAVAADDDGKVGADDEQCALTLNRLKSAFSDADTNNDGTVDYDEFLQVLHPEFKQNDTCAMLGRQKTVETSFDAAKFNVTNKMAKGLLLRPKYYSDKDVVDKDKDNIIEELKKENNKLRVRLKLKNTELNDAKSIYSNNITKVLRLQMENDGKDKKIKQLNDQLNRTKSELQKLRQSIQARQSD